MSTDASEQEWAALPHQEPTEPRTGENRLRVPASACAPYDGLPEKYRSKVVAVAFVEWGISHGDLTWPQPWCETQFCLTLDHLTWKAPARLEYPAGVCTYCGQLSGTRDHLLPRTWTGDGMTRWNVLTVPACAECNSSIGDKYVPSITERRAIAQKALRRRKRRVLAMPNWSRAQLDETQGMLRKFIEKGVHERALVRARLAWPEDADYDLRVMQLSGIENPYELGLLTLPTSKDAA